MALGPNKPRPVRTVSAGVPAVGSTAYDNLNAPDIGGTFSYTVRAGCSSCRGSARPKPPVEVSVDMVLRAALETRTAPGVLAQQDAAALKTVVRAARRPGVATVPDAYLNAAMMIKIGKHAVDQRIVPFNPYHASARNMQGNARYADWFQETTALLNPTPEPAPEPDAVPVEQSDVVAPVPTKATDIVKFLTAHPERVDEIEQAELELAKPRQTVIKKIAAVRNL